VALSRRVVRSLCAAVAPVAVVAVLGVACNAAAATGPGPTVQVTATSDDLGWHLTRLRDVRFTTAQPRAARTIDVDDSVRYQRFEGVGGAMTDSSAWLIYDELAPATRDRLMDALFGADGIRLNFLRVPIGASDFTATGTPYTYDDLPAGHTDPTLAHFSIAHDLPYIVPALREAIASNPHLQTLAEAWSPPAWMKTNGALDNLHNRGRLRSSALQPFALYLARFLTTYRHLGIRVDAITPQNEPQAPTAFPGLNLSSTAEARFIVHQLVPALDAAGVHPKIYGLDRGALYDYAQSLVTGPAREDLTGLAWHCYGGPAYIEALHLLAPQLDEIVSECSPGLAAYEPSEAMIGSLRAWASTVGLWNLALDPAGGPVQQPNRGCPRCTGIVTIDEQTHAVTYGLNYYQLGQVSKFVSPGAVRIASTSFVTNFRTPDGVYGATPGLDDVAFANPDGSIALVAYNSSGSRLRFVVAADGRAFRYALPPRTTATFVWRG
jgi:glucosylceramidase